MGEIVLGAPIHELVASLNKLSTKEISEIKSEFNELGEELEDGVIAGESIAPNNAIILYKAKFTSKILYKTIPIANKTLKVILKKISKSNRVKFFGQLAAVIGSSSAIGAIVLDESLIAQLSSALALIGSISGIVASYYESVISKKSGSLSDIYLRLSGYIQEAMFIKNDIDAYMKYDPNSDKLIELIASGNNLAGKINTDKLQIF